MKTKINITDYLTKGFILAIIAVSLMINISAQRSQDFLNSGKYAYTETFATDLNTDNTKKLLSRASSSSDNTNVSLEAFLIKAAGINSFASVEELETSESNINNEERSFEQFLISAAGLNKVEICNAGEKISDTEKDLLNFLTHAARLDSVQEVNSVSVESNTESQEDDMTDFLIKAAGLNMNNSSTMN